MTHVKSFIEVQFPVSKLSKESYKERKAGESQTLSSLGKWHGRKPLVLVRALVLGLLLPASDNPKRDREIFLALMTMDDEGMWLRCKGLSAKEASRHLSPTERDEATVERDSGQIAWKHALPLDKRKSYEKRAFLRMGYDERLTHCLRPEEIDGPNANAWHEINVDLGTTASCLCELVRELGVHRFGHVAKIGDAFAGGGSIPFEAARLGCDAFASDLNPTAALQNYGALRIVGGSPETLDSVKTAQSEVYNAVRKQVLEWGIERNEVGWEADVFLYCSEVLDPISGWRVPLLPSMAVDPGRGVIVELIPDPFTKTIDFRVRTDASEQEVANAKTESTADDGVICPFDSEGNLVEKTHRQRTSGKTLRGQEGLRLWQSTEYKPRPTDVYQERLYCVRWLVPDFERLLAVEQVLCSGRADTYDDWTRDKIVSAVNALVALLSEESKSVVGDSRRFDWSERAWEFLRAQDTFTATLPGAEWGDLEVKQVAGVVSRVRRTFPDCVQLACEIARRLPRRHYAAPTKDDLRREQLCEDLLDQHFAVWQRKGFLPSIRMEPGRAIKDPIRNRGWSYWHQLYSPRQLLLNGLFVQQMRKFTRQSDKAALILSAQKVVDHNSKCCRWDSGNAQVHQTLDVVKRFPALVNFASRSSGSLAGVFFLNIETHAVAGNSEFELSDATTTKTNCDFWITDPGYGDMAPYAEYSEFYLAWVGREIQSLFTGWYSDSKRALAVELADDNFAQLLSCCYSNLAANMPDDGLQVVMFTQQDVQVWADLTLLLWAAGLQVIQAWTVGTETASSSKDGGGNTVQGTVCLVLRKRSDGVRGDLSEIRPEVQLEVREQLQSMLALDDKESPNFSDSDYQLAAYAAALRVITSYDSIREIDIHRELARGGRPDPGGIVRGVIDHALREATDFLVPDGLDRTTWKGRSPEERLYLKGVEVEAHGERRKGVYEEFARGFGVREYRDLLQSDAANETRLRTPSELKGRNLESGPMGGTVLRRVLYAIYQTVEEAMNPTPAIVWLRGKYPGMTFFDARQAMTRIVQFLASKPSGERMHHWKKDAEAAYLLAARLENEN